MKNLSVGKKLGVGYGVIIVLLVVILIMTFITSSQREAQLQGVARITNLQEEANLLLGEVNESRVELRTFFTSNTYTDEYEKAVAYLNSAIARIDVMDSYVAQMDAAEGSAFVEANAALRSIFGKLMPLLANIHANDAVLDGSITALKATSDQMVSAAFVLVGNVRQFLGSDAETLSNYVDTVTLPAVSLCEKINAFSVAGEAFALSMDLTLVPGMAAIADEIERDIIALEGSLQTEAGRAAVATVADSVHAYRAAEEQSVACYEQSVRLISDARTELANLSAVLASGVVAINASVNASVSGLISVSKAVMLLMMAISVLAALAAVGIAILLTRAFTRPLKKMQAVMQQAGGTGDLHFSNEVKQDMQKETTAKDEIGRSLLLFTQFIDRVIYISECLEKVADKDLGLELELLGTDDTMGNALATMLDNLNHTFADINSVAAQVATASNEIAQGAQSLAQGSTEQASTVEEISASVNEITDQSRAASHQADEAARFSGSIRQTAEDGSVKMAAMIDSVQQINDASQDIGAVIKVIDDIAFQTNILALNAAVEAARAGEHGKGFAVVADEVRNLAGKSADAAKKTAELISANIEKAGTGMAMAQETSESLRQIVEGIEKTSASLSDIAEQSAANEQATVQVNLAIDQVAQVVQQNSATSEESAAASEEMSSQAQTLQSLIGQFRLRHTRARRQLPALPAAQPGNESPAAQGAPIF